MVSVLRRKGAQGAGSTDWVLGGEISEGFPEEVMPKQWFEDENPLAKRKGGGQAEEPTRSKGIQV